MSDFEGNTRSVLVYWCCCRIFYFLWVGHTRAKYALHFPTHAPDPDRLFNLSLMIHKQACHVHCSEFAQKKTFFVVHAPHAHTLLSALILKSSSIAFSLTRVNKFLSFLLFFSPIWNEFWMSTKENSSIFGKFSNSKGSPIRLELWQCWWT